MIWPKLVRDKAVQYLTDQGHSLVVERLHDDDRYRAALVDKLQEEVDELKADPSEVEEMADVLEVLFALAQLAGFDERALRIRQFHKQVERGGFEDRVYVLGARGGAANAGAGQASV